MTTAVPNRIMRLGETCRATGRCKSAIYDDMKADRFPKPVKLGPRAVGWLAHEVDEWIAARVAERDEA